MKKRRLLLAVLAAVPLCAKAEDIDALMKRWSVVTSGDLNSVHDIQGKAYIGGNVNIDYSFNVGQGVAFPKDDIALAVKGKVLGSGDIHVDNGSVVVGRKADASRFGYPHPLNSGGTLKINSPADLPASPVKEFTSSSVYWNTLANNGKTSVTSAGNLMFTCDPKASLTVFDISADDMFSGKFQNFDLAESAATKTVIINIRGSTVNWRTGSFLDGFQNHENVLFNFADAKTVNFQNPIWGYVVAPNADVTTVNNIFGGVMAKDLKVGSEVDLHCDITWNGFAPLPEPATWISGAFALGILGTGVARSVKSRKSA